MNAVKQILLDDLQLTKKRLGSGGFGTVFIVKDKIKSKLYAAKILKEEDMNSIKTEINNHAKCHHPAIIEFIGFNEHGFPKCPGPTLFLDYAQKGSLAKSSKDDDDIAIKELTYKQKLIISYGVASAMDFMHQNNLLHRDLKPGNILLDENYYPKVSDLGLSKQLINSIADSTTIKGTPCYLAPEIFDEDSTYTRSSDVYAFAIILYQLFVKNTKNIFDLKIFNIYVIGQKLKNGKRPEIGEDIPKHIKNLITECWKDVYTERPTFEQISNILKSDDFLRPLNEHEREDFNKYIEYIKNKPSKFDDDEVIIVSEKTNENLLRIKKAAHNKDKKVYFEYAQMLDNGTGGTINHKKANKYYKEAADDGQLDAIICYANKLDQGINIKQDEQAACKYFEKAADAGDESIMCLYGLRLLKGTQGAKQDVKKAFNYFQKAANKNHYESMCNLALMLKEGYKDVCKRDPNSAASYFKKAADGDFAEAMYHYAKMKEEGDSEVSIDIEEAKEYYKKGADKDNIKSMIAYSLLIERNEENHKYKEACDYLKKAADKEDVDGMFHYGRILDEGKIIKKDLEKALEYYKCAADDECAEANYIIGLKYEKGDGVDKDFRKAYDYFKKACECFSKDDPKIKDQNKVEESEAKYNEFQLFVRKIDEKDPEMLYKYGCELEKMKKIEFAMWYYNEALQQNHLSAMNNYAKLLINDKDPERIKEASDLFKHAADNDQLDSMYNYARLMEINDDKNAAIKYYEKSINFPSKIYSESQLKSMNNYSLLIYSLDDDDPNKNLENARKYLKMAANYGYVDSMFNCGLFYYKGVLFDRDLEKAAKYFKRAADNDHKKSMESYAFMLKRGRGTHQDKRKAQKYLKKAKSLPS